MAPAHPRIFVVGCPRSGTSPFARWLHSCGLTTVEDERRTARYPAGYFEHMPVLMFHKALERLPRGADHAITLEPFLHREYLEDPFIGLLFREAFRPLLEHRIDFLKFPQLALSFDFILETFEDSHVVAIWRDPRTVFRSLVRREFPREMIPASGGKAILLWSMYAAHIVRAAEQHPDRVTVLSIDDFVRSEGAEAALLKRLGRADLAGVPVHEGVNLAMWNESIPSAWAIYHSAMSLACRMASSRFGAERAALADQVAWTGSLRRLSWSPD